MTKKRRRKPVHLVVVPGHAVYAGSEQAHCGDDDRWFLLPFQRGEPPRYVEHVWRGVREARDEAALLVFSGGFTRAEAGPRSEAYGYWQVARQHRWWGDTRVSKRAVTEEYARDSYENLLFSVCRFRETTGRYPDRVTVVGWGFKGQRFQQHREALGLPRLDYVAVNEPEDLEGARAGERRTREAFVDDPYGVRVRDGFDPARYEPAHLGEKRLARDPFGRATTYAGTCLELAGLLAHRGPEPYRGPLPWRQER